MTKQYLVFDVGGTSIKYGLIDDRLNLTQQAHCLTKHNQAGHIVKMLVQITRQFQDKFKLSGIGVSTAGIVDSKGSIQYAGPTIPDYQGTPVKSILMAESSLPVVVVNDVDAALLGEQLAGSAQNSETAYCVALGTGIGGAYLAHGRLLNGAHGTANSLAYTQVTQRQSKNYEQLASTLALEKHVQSLGLSVPAAFEAAKHGDTACLAIIQTWAGEVAVGLAQVILMFDPEILVIGGAVSQQGEFLLTLLREQLQLLLPAQLCQTELKMAVLAEQAQLYGAVSGLR